MEKTITIKPFVCEYPNGIRLGLKLKRKLTLKECMYLFTEVLGYDYEIQDDELDDNTFVRDMNEFVRGTYSNTSVVEDYSNTNDVPVEPIEFIDMILYLQKIDVL